MNYLRLLLVVALVGHFSAGRVAAQEKAPFRVGMVTRSYEDEARKNWQATGPRPLRTAVWYPAAATSAREETIFGGAPETQVFAPLTFSPSAALSQSSQKYPLVLISHGTGGSAVMMMWLGSYLAERGYIVAAVNHHGNTAVEKEPTAQGFSLIWERPRDLTVVLDKLLADPLFGKRIDRNRIGAAGFSLGGYTVMSIAGGVFSLKEFDDFCDSPQRDFTCEPQPEFPQAQVLLNELAKTNKVVQTSLLHAGDSYVDKRIKCVFAIAPALGSGLTKASLRAVKIPVRIVVGRADGVTPLATNAQVFADSIKGAELTVLPGEVGHYTFLATCTPHGEKSLPVCRDGAGVDRAAVHAQVSRMAFEFFEQSLAKK